MRVKGRQTLDAGQVVLGQRLRRRQREIERALARTFRPENPGHVQDLKRSTEIDAALSAVTEFTLDCIESGDDESDPLPSAAIAQARRAARDGIELDVFLVAVIAAQALLNEFVLEESTDLSGESLRDVQLLQDSLLLRFVTELAGEYRREKRRLDESSARRQIALVERLLSGAPVADHEVDYSLKMWHLGLVVSGARAMDAARALAEFLGTALLAVPRGEGTVWAWLGSNRRLTAQLVQDAVRNRRSIRAKFAVGEPGKDLEGWRSTHLEAKAALGVAIRSSGNVTCFSDVALEAIALQMPDLVHSLLATYLAPLGESKRRAATLRETLRAYFDAGRNVSSAAVALEVSRRTVENRLRLIEQKLGRPLLSSAAELELALRLEELGPSGNNVLVE
jgi:hypothetical protein